MHLYSSLSLKSIDITHVCWEQNSLLQLQLFLTAHFLVFLWLQAMTNQRCWLWVRISLRPRSISEIWSSRRLWLTMPLLLQSSLPGGRAGLGDLCVPLGGRARPSGPASCSLSFSPTCSEREDPGTSVAALQSAASDEILAGLTPQHAE